MTNDELKEIAHSVNGMIAALTILSFYMDEGMETKYFCHGEHDIIYSYVPGNVVNADDAARLEALGWMIDDDTENWVYLT